MNNERIDLTQFEGHTEGPWYAEEEEQEDGKAWTVRGADHWVVMESDGCLRIDWKKEDALLTAALPDLIAELKRMYESEDRLLELLQEIEYRYDVPVKQIAALMSI
tara:strand:- start:14 stop:331 length:318 start_codon:yes stop_codon:yes gene_type:complete